MQALTRLISVLLVLALAGGAQACIASCANPASPTTEKHACHRCDHSSKPAPQPPCKNCQTAAQDRVAAERDHLTTTAFDLSFSPLLELAPARPLTRPLIQTPRPPTHGPPGNLFHQFCLLLI